MITAGTLLYIFCRVGVPLPCNVYIFTYLQDTARVHLELELEVFDVQTAISTLCDLYHIGAALPPRKYIGVVLERPNKHDGSVRENTQKIIHQSGKRQNEWGVLKREKNVRPANSFQSSRRYSSSVRSGPVGTADPRAKQQKEGMTGKARSTLGHNHGNEQIPHIDARSLKAREVISWWRTFEANLNISSLVLLKLRPASHLMALMLSHVVGPPETRPLLVEADGGHDLGDRRRRV